MLRLTDPELLNPEVHCFARCFICQKLIRIQKDEKGLVLDERKCPHCGVFIEREQILSSLAQNIFHTSAIASAHKLTSFDPAVIPYIASGLLVAYFGFPLWFRAITLVVYLLPIVVLIKWMYKYWYKIRFTDEEYLQALSSIRQSLALWVFTNVLYGALFLI